ncbi:MAG: tRNA-splicing endonuclease subunit sen54 [Thelocarpon impressellum]|nr:MAG: tRNA-splicing endonuclease subunit sen54 [Thelocarpon impressellum]
MADVDEDNLRDPHPDPGDVDLSDETQDFRFLSNFAQDGPFTIPRRGEKDFEPHGTSHQDSLLAASRNAMHHALSSTRVHIPKTHLVGHWHADVSQCAIPKPNGPHFKTLGKGHRDGSMWLLPEEMLYLLERGALDVRWGGGEEAEGVPMSLQGAYAVCIGDEMQNKIGLERWNVYAALKRRLHRSYNDIYRRLFVIPHYDPTLPSERAATSHNTSSPFRVAFDVWKPRPAFRKSAPETPDYRIAVVSARDTPLPSLAQLSALLESTPYCPPPADMKTKPFQRLKHGYRNVLLAVVDQGVVSYLRLSEVGFGLEKMHERASARPQKGGKRGGSRGRGRGGKGRGR